MSVHIGLGTLPGQVPPDGEQTAADVYEDLLALGRVADEVGFDSVWVSSHHGAANAHLPSPLALLAALAAVTERIQLGTAMVLAPFQHPLRFAEDCAVLDQLSRGRLVVGLSAGWRKAEFDAFGVPLTERVGRTVELARICRLAWDQPRFSFSGKYFSFEDVALTPKPYGYLPLLLGGNVPAAVARAGRLADGFIATPHNRIATFRAQTAAFDAAARAAGRDPAALAIGFHVNGWVSKDGSVACTVQRAMWHQMGAYSAWHAEDDGRASDAVPPLAEALVRERAMLGTPAEVSEQARPWIEEFGHRELHVLLRLHYPGLRREAAEAALRLFAAEVIPRLKQHQRNDMAEEVSTHE